MRRIEVSSEQLAKISSLRQRNTSWAQIQRETGVSRRIAQRVHEQSSRSEARGELKAARKDVAVEEFRNHLHCLIKLAQRLVTTLDIPSSSSTVRANEVLHYLWQTDIVGEYGAYGLRTVPPRPDPGMEWSFPREICCRQNKILFKSLKDHTHVKVDWQALEKWKHSWDTCIEVQDKLKEKAHEMLLNFLNQKPNLRDRIVKQMGKKDAIGRMVDGVLHLVWQGILDGKLDQSPLGKAMSRDVGSARTEVIFGEGHLSLGLIFTETDLAKEVEDRCNWVVNNLWIEEKGNMVDLVNNVNTIRKQLKTLPKC